MEAAAPGTRGAGAQKNQLLLPGALAAMRQRTGRGITISDKKERAPQEGAFADNVLLDRYFFSSSLPPCSAAAAACSSSICLRSCSWRLERTSARLERLASITFSLPSSS